MIASVTETSISFDSVLGPLISGPAPGTTDGLAANLRGVGAASVDAAVRAVATSGAARVEALFPLALVSHRVGAARRPGSVSEPRSGGSSWSDSTALPFNSRSGGSLSVVLPGSVSGVSGASPVASSRDRSVDAGVDGSLGDGSGEDEADPGEVDDEVVDVVSSAQAVPGTQTIAPPMPRATAKAPTRPM
ncbi:hypothetical protein V4U86_05125 [Mycobacterium sp. AMU20-3851]|uniref:hypothetical protein n=1 Tax=Mycobacterium sp. AMU20-3851 TaxID=3122055 RepID=UPI003753F407